MRAFALPASLCELEAACKAECAGRRDIVGAIFCVLVVRANGTANGTASDHSRCSELTARLDQLRTDIALVEAELGSMHCPARRSSPIDPTAVARDGSAGAVGLSELSSDPPTTQLLLPQPVSPCRAGDSM